MGSREFARRKSVFNLQIAIPFERSGILVRFNWRPIEAKSNLITRKNSLQTRGSSLSEQYKTSNFEKYWASVSGHK